MISETFELAEYFIAMMDARTRVDFVAAKSELEKLDAVAGKEFDLLAYLMRNSGRVLSKDQITEHVWGYDSQATSNVVEIYIHYLRDKIDRGFPRPLIRTVRGVGYTIKD